MHLEVKVEEVLWEVLEDLEEADQVQVDLAQAQEDHLVAKEVSWMHLEVKVEEVLWEVLEDLEEADLAQEDLAQVQEEVQWEDQEEVAPAQEDQGQVQVVLAQVQVDHLVAKEVSWTHLEVKVEEVLWEVLEDTDLGSKGVLDISVGNEEDLYLTWKIRITVGIKLLLV